MTEYNDIDLAISPADGYRVIREMAHIVTEANGGNGVAREVADLLVGSRTDLKLAHQQQKSLNNCFQYTLFLKAIMS